jgi:hypothetical protein
MLTGEAVAVDRIPPKVSPAVDPKVDMEGSVKELSNLSLSIQMKHHISQYVAFNV